MRLLFDTSVLIATRDEPDGVELPDDATEVAVSVVSVAELAVGVLTAKDEKRRATRLAALSALERSYDPLPVDNGVAHAYAHLVAAAKANGRKPRVMDTLIAATALVHGSVVVTRDDDFHAFTDAGVDVLVV
jgi:predicted nucleic acid-binding protein